MGFGSYDESEQENQEFDTDIDDDASSEDLLETFEEIKGE